MFDDRHDFVEMVPRHPAIVNSKRGNDSRMPLQHCLVTSVDGSHHLVPASFYASAQSTQAILYSFFLQNIHHLGDIIA